MYSFYLNKTQVTDGVFACAPITKVVTQHTKYVTELLGYDVYTAQNFDELSMMFKVNESYVVKIVEGCSSVAVIILFLAFIIAFSGKLKSTILFGISGIVLIYVVNILRIVLLALAIYQYPKYQNVLHNIIFPAIIYGMVFILWAVWVRKYAKIGEKR